MPQTKTILVVDDDPHIREVVRFALRREGFDTAEAADGEEALREYDLCRPALVILDILMPELDGTDVARQLRERSDVPIIFLTSKNEELDRVVGLELGGDDYVTKPFSPRELVARVRAVLRRSRPERGERVERAGKGKLRHGKLTLDLDRYQAFWRQDAVALTATEFGLLRALAAFPGKVYSRDELMESGYREDNIVSGRTIDSHIRRIRKKFAEAGGEPVETVHGLGYKLGPCR